MAAPAGWLVSTTSTPSRRRSNRSTGSTSTRLRPCRTQSDSPSPPSSGHSPHRWHRQCTASSSPECAPTQQTRGPGNAAGLDAESTMQKLDLVGDHALELLADVDAE